eukprot:g7371.t1
MGVYMKVVHNPAQLRAKLSPDDDGYVFYSINTENVITSSGMPNNDGKSASSDYFYMVTGVGAQCESFKDTTGGRIDNTIDCDYAREGTGYCKEYHNGDNHYDTNGVYRESKSSYPEGCYCKSTAPDHEYIITLNSRASGKDCDNEYCLCISRTKDYVVKGGARCENNNFIQTEEACLAIVLKKIQDGTSMPRRAPATTQPPQMVQRTQMINVQKPNQMQPNPIAYGMNQPQMQPVAMNPNQNMMMQGQQPQMMQGQVMAINPNQNMMMGGQPQMQQQVVVNAVPMNK